MGAAIETVLAYQLGMKKHEPVDIAIIAEVAKAFQFKIAFQALLKRVEAGVLSVAEYEVAEEELISWACQNGF